MEQIKRRSENTRIHTMRLDDTKTKQPLTEEINKSIDESQKISCRKY